MGGRRYSDIVLQRERAEKLQLIQEIAAMKGTIDGYHEALGQLLRTSTAGIRDTFAGLVQSANGWTRTAEQLLSRPADIDSAIGELKAAYAELSALAPDGEKLMKEVSLSFTKIGDAMSRELAERLVHVQSFVAAHRRECAGWFPEEVGRWSSRLQAASEQFDQENYAALTGILDELEAEVSELAKRSGELAAKQQSRMYLLKSLRQVCCNLGMRETGPPHYERSGDATSRILFTVTSADRGDIAFTLSFDGVRSDAQPGRCLNDLEKLSSFLSAKYGIDTSFQQRSEGADPELRPGSARSRPEDCDSAATA